MLGGNYLLKSEELFKDYPSVLSVAQMAEMLNIGIVLAYRLVREKKIKARKIGKDYKILKNVVIDYLEGGNS